MITIQHSLTPKGTQLRLAQGAKTTAQASYACAVRKPNYPMPAVIRCQWCYSDNEVCDYNGDGYWCPSLCFQWN